MPQIIKTWAGVHGSKEGGADLLFAGSIRPELLHARAREYLTLRGKLEFGKSPRFARLLE
jgi:hypothetical protein